MKKLKCIRLNEWPNGKYELDSKGEDAMDEDAMVGSTSSYYIKDDNNEYKYFLKVWFIDIVEERDNKLNQLGI